MKIKSETATVFRSITGRRFLTKRGAVRSSVSKLIKNYFECSCDEHWGDNVPGGYFRDVCFIHRDDNFQKLLNRYTQFYYIFSKCKAVK